MATLAFKAYIEEDTHELTGFFTCSGCPDLVLREDLFLHAEDKHLAPSFSILDTPENEPTD